MKLLWLTWFLLVLRPLPVPQEPVWLAFKKEPIVLRSSTFSLLRILDERRGKSQIGAILSAPKTAIPVRIQEELRGVFDDLLSVGFRPDSMRVPVVIRIQELAFTEKPKTDSQVDGTCRLELAFDVMREGKPVQLTTYTARTIYTRSFGQTDRLEFVARKALENAVQYLSNWIKINRDKSPALVKGIKFAFIDHSIQQASGDTVFYHPLRPLTWDDFQAEPRLGSRNAAAIFPTFSYEGHSRWVNGYILVELTFKTFMVKNMSWVRPGHKDDYGLRHEQKHFDIAKLIVERFKQRIAADEHMDLDDYNSRVQFLYLDAYRDMNRWQQQYDDETQHGINQAEQERWNRKIAEDLKNAEDLTAIMISNRQ
ncbi:DUF922 domain-containing protein [Larkinella rosea]|uniref:DUF922 domain-containing protein n=1 Tax=Larkinella rosea TaxID=2025312 RepID=A0A3P1BJ65_9BACT|nr:DUF922 domain-containing protein [Larkinella rosea]RRB01179.1 hypothetical protein EHT25_23685 [Larkinella rosea]